MRMWKVNPKYLCSQHLLGEHVEMHMFVGAINKGKNISGYIEKGLVEINNIKKRHLELAFEIGRRGMRHKSKLPEFWYSINLDNLGKINTKKSMRDLFSRCPKCQTRYEKLKGE